MFVSFFIDIFFSQAGMNAKTSLTKNILVNHQSWYKKMGCNILPMCSYVKLLTNRVFQNPSQRHDPWLSFCPFRKNIVQLTHIMYVALYCLKFPYHDDSLIVQIEWKAYFEDNVFFNAGVLGFIDSLYLFVTYVQYKQTNYVFVYSLQFCKGRFKTRRVS